MFLQKLSTLTGKGQRVKLVRHAEEQAVYFGFQYYNNNRLTAVKESNNVHQYRLMLAVVLACFASTSFSKAAPDAAFIAENGTERNKSRAALLQAENLQKLGDQKLLSFNYEDAIKDYKLSLELSGSNNAGTKYRLGVCYQRLGDFSQAARNMQEAATLWGDTLNGSLARIDTFLLTLDINQSIKAAETACRKYPQEWKPFMRLGYCHSLLYEYQDAINAYTQAISMFKQNPSAEKPMSPAELVGSSSGAKCYALRAQCFFKLGKYSECISDCDQFIKTEGETGFAYAIRAGYESRAEAFMRLGNYEAARRDFLKAIEYKTERARTYKQLAVCQIKSGDYREAESSLTAAIKLFPKYAEAFELRSLVREKLAQKELAASDAVTARQLRI